MEQCVWAVLNSRFPSVFLPAFHVYCQNLMKSNSSFGAFFIIIACGMFQISEIPLLNIVLDAGFIHYYLYALFLSQDTVHFSQAQYVHL